MPNWKLLVNYNYLGSQNFNKGEEKVLTIKKVNREIVVSEGGKSEYCVVIYFEEPDIKPFVANKTNCKTISKIYNSPLTEDWVGKKIQIYPTTTKLKGEIVDCLRIRPFVPIGSKPTYKCSVCGKEVDEKIALGSIKKYGKIYCSEKCKDESINGKNYL